MEHGFVTARFDGNNKDFAFKNILEDLKVGDRIVVETVRGFQVATVFGFPETVERHVGSWTVDKVDMTKYDSIKETRAKEKENKARKMELNRKMKSLINKKIMPQIVEQYAEKDEEYAELLKEYKQL